MDIEITIRCKPSGVYADQIRQLFCRESRLENPEDRNPLIETEFNELLEQISQAAFEAGRSFKFPTK